MFENCTCCQILRLWLFGLTLVFVSMSGCSKPEQQEETVAPKVDDDGDNDYRKAQVEFKGKKYEEAITLLDAALKKKLKLYSKSDVLQLLGLSYRHLYKYDKAIEYFDQSIAENPDNHEAYVLRGVVYRVQKKYAKAAESYNKALELKPDNAELHTSLGALHIYQEQYEKAVEHLKLAIDLDGSAAVRHSNLALAYANLGDFDKAESSLKQATILGYKQPDVIQAKIDSLKLAEIEKGPKTK